MSHSKFQTVQAVGEETPAQVFSCEFCKKI